MVASLPQVRLTKIGIVYIPKTTTGYDCLFNFILVITDWACMLCRIAQYLNRINSARRTVSGSHSSSFPVTRLKKYIGDIFESLGGIPNLKLPRYLHVLEYLLR